MRNLNGHELNGRTLRVDNAANERTKEEIRNLQSSLGGTFESPYGPEVDPREAPEAISKAVASLPPEQMFELAKQMKHCIQTNPNEARNMLLHNPQLAYALLQALVVMKIVDPQVALSILHRPTQIPNLTSQEPPVSIPPASIPGQGPNAAPWNPKSTSDPFMRVPQPAPVPPVVPAALPNDPRAMDPRTLSAPIGGVDPRIRSSTLGQPPVFDPRLSHTQGSAVGAAALAGTTASTATRVNQVPGEEQVKAELIQQVLQLSDAQIAVLPPDQRQSITLLKELYARGGTPR